MKIELKHLAPYLPYGIKMELTEDKSEDFAWQDFATDLEIFEKGAIWELIGINKAKDLIIPMGEGYLDGFLFRNDHTYVNFHTGFKPILRPLSDLTKEIEHNGEKFVPMEYILSMTSKSFKDSPRQERLTEAVVNDLKFGNLQYKYVQKLFEWHFDVFSLLEEIDQIKQPLKP